ncbi:MAG: UDP-N-acetylmuramoyl-L-alanyl-D-glutamate--2,6-diaminopimelate ligase [Gallionellaceae bacterium]|nr:UDP-N-acetylmuramoyl-L-alanyl-D-glutamate--2,6-diaminopimelate ligase [Gallionellaceae bacterium]
MFPLDQLNKLGVKITRLVTDSREVTLGDTFVAYPGENSDGRRFIAQAIAQGANAVIYEKLMSGHPWEAQNFAWDDAWQVPNLAVSDLRHQAGWLADAAYGAPTEKLWLVGVTGTNGKTSTSHWIAHALNDAGRKCALIGTLGNGYSGALQPGTHTTPEAIRVHDLCANYLRDGAQAVAMEVSSHALAQGRVNGVHFDVALLTNLSRDHLDYHGNMENYAASKRRLFNWETLKSAVINLDDSYGAGLAEEILQRGFWPAVPHPNPPPIPLSNFPPQAGERTNEKNNLQSLGEGANEALRAISIPEVIGYGMSDAALQLAERLGIRMVYGNLLAMNTQGMQLKVHSSWGGVQLDSALIGRFNASNLLGTLAVLLVSDVTLDEATRSLGRVQPVAGRMQRVGNARQPAVIVDYAHTPDALEKVLLALREVSGATGGRLICVFGCGGDRDRGKRPMMGLIAGKFADHCIITSDNPRSEDPEKIIAEVLAGMDSANHEIIAGRAEAIAHAIGMASRHDTVLIAGKGHENYQEIAGVRHPFSDVAVAGLALEHWRAQS